MSRTIKITNKKTGKSRTVKITKKDKNINKHRKLKEMQRLRKIKGRTYT